MKLTTLKTKRVERIVDELDRVQKRIMDRAHKIFTERGAAFGAALDDWLAAERQTIWKPAIELSQTDAGFVVEAAVAGVEPRDLDIQVTSDTLIIKATTTHGHPQDKGKVHVCEFQSGELFRLITLPAPIEPDTVKAEYRNGLLRITAAIAASKETKKVEVHAA